MQAALMCLPLLLVLASAYDVHSFALELGQQMTEVVDFHNHFERGLNVDVLIQMMDKAGVSQIIMQPKNLTDDIVLGFQEKNPNRIIPFVGFQNRRWYQQDPTFIGYVEQQLRTGKFKGLGEVLLRHYAILGRDAPDINIPADSPLMLKVLDLAAKYNVPVLVHLEAEDGTLPAFRRMLDHNRAVTVVWGHQGRASVNVVRDFLLEYPNLFVDIAALCPGSRLYGTYASSKNPIATTEASLLAEWKELYEAFSTRVVIGVDFPFLDLWDKYIDAVACYRKLLSSLESSTQHRILSENAKAILRRTQTQVSTTTSIAPATPILRSTQTDISTTASIAPATPTALLGAVIAAVVLLVAALAYARRREPRNGPPTPRREAHMMLVSFLRFVN